ncbi:Protein CBG27863 [Caenorhabditis briggsae]|uniref:Protein CBG27863 n=1 Tax=Caenorhabditis briggsae TaxID=6238 RepID=B6IEF8_CAEBR|nr:Protein CBG27863 [Caenorhabditis briggsae]CAR98288.1 Protein CBG27863 [Caenorhabditis briggsae]
MFEGDVPFTNVELFAIGLTMFVAHTVIGDKTQRHSSQYNSSMKLAENNPKRKKGDFLRKYGTRVVLIITHSGRNDPFLFFFFIFNDLGVLGSFIKQRKQKKHYHKSIKASIIAIKRASEQHIERSSTNLPYENRSRSSFNSSQFDEIARVMYQAAGFQIHEHHS